MTAKPPRLTICVPVYDERGTLRAALERLFSLQLRVSFEVVAVDDGSGDGSGEILRDAAASSAGFLRAFFHEENRGKSAALSTAFGEARGSILAVQDADLEYDPAEFAHLLLPILRGRADAVFGSRYLPGSEREGGTFVQAVANRALTTLCNAVTGLRLTDMETCQKVFLRRFLGPLPLRARGFCVEPELCFRLASRGARVVERPIAYRFRTRAEGKKIGWRDGVAAVVWMARRASRD